MIELPFKWLFSSNPAKPDPHHLRLEQCLRQTVEAIDPLILQSRHYPDTFRKILHQALDYIYRLIDQLPPALSLDSEQFITNPRVRALFASPEELLRTLRLSIAMREYQPDCPDCHTLYALMGVRWERHQRFGIEEKNGVIQRDVPQQVINFKDHTFTLPATDEAGCRGLIRRHFIDRLSHQVRNELIQIREQRDHHYRRGKRLERELSQGESTPEQIEESWQAWRRLNHQLDVDRIIEHYQLVMADPAEHLRLEPHVLVIDDMGVERSVVNGGKRIELFDLHSSDRRIWSLSLVSFRWQPPRSAAEQLNEASRWLSI